METYSLHLKESLVCKNSVEESLGIGIRRWVLGISDVVVVDGLNVLQYTVAAISIHKTLVDFISFLVKPTNTTTNSVEWRIELLGKRKMVFGL